MYVLWGALREDNVCFFISSIDIDIDGEAPASQLAAISLETRTRGRVRCCAGASVALLRQLG